MGLESLLGACERIPLEGNGGGEVWLGGGDEERSFGGRVFKGPII